LAFAAPSEDGEVPDVRLELEIVSQAR